MKRCPACQAAFSSDYAHCPRDGSALVEVGEWLEGAVVRGKYRILAKVGQGGMGSVYKAVHTRFKEVRALKVISPELANNADFVQRFEQEAVVARRLQHPNAVRVEDFDEAEDGRPFIVMEYIEGRNLADVIEQESPMAVPRVCAIVKQAAAALDAAHQLGLVHRDIKPGNIALVSALDESGSAIEQVKVLDFGIAKVLGAQADAAPARPATATGMLIGTPAYMSPEQAKGIRGDQLDGRSDLYSLGVVMYEMLTGILPFDAATTVEHLAAHLKTPPRPIKEVCPDLNVPHEISAALMRCLEKDPAMRPSSGKELAGELDLAVKPAPIPDTPPAPLPTPPSTPPPAPPSTTPSVSPEPSVTESDVTEKKTSWDVRMLWIGGTLVVLSLVLILAGLTIGAWRYEHSAWLEIHTNRCCANVLLDGVSRGETGGDARLRIYSLTPGGHHLRLVPSASDADYYHYEPAEQDIELRSGQNYHDIFLAAKSASPSPSAESVTAARKARAERVQKLIAQGNDQRNAGSYDQAIITFQQALKLEPNNKDAAAGLRGAQKGKQDEEALSH
jgi:serine/threonine-protein kinase